MASFTDKVVIVTGCASGIGLATTKLFLERGAKVFGVDVGAFEAREEEVGGLPFEFHRADLVEGKAVGEVVARCEFAFFHLVSAGSGGLHWLEDGNASRWRMGLFFLFPPSFTASR